MDSLNNFLNYSVVLIEICCIAFTISILIIYRFLIILVVGFLFVVRLRS